MDEGHATALGRTEDGQAVRRHLSLPFVTNEERDFWRRAVAAERQRQRLGRPAPFPFQPA